MEVKSLARAAALLRERNAIDAELAGLMQRPMTSGHLGEWIAVQIFDIELESSAAAAGIDGHPSGTKPRLALTPQQAEQLSQFSL